MTSLAPEMQRAADILGRLAEWNDRPSPRPPAQPVMIEEALAVIKDLMDEIQRRDIREGHARRKADELVGWLNGRWG